MTQQNDNGGQIRMYGGFRRFEPGDSNRSLYDIVCDLQNSVIRVPTFQREFVWKIDKRLAFVGRLADGRKPIGVISTYEIEGDEQHTVYLNDGYQRLSTCIDLLDNPTKYGLPSLPDAVDLLRSYTFSVQHRRYADHDEALQDYKDINQGTVLTAFEFFKGDITNIPNYEFTWKPRIDRLHAIINAAIQRSGANASGQRKDAHKYLRHDYALFVRLASEEKDTKDYKLSEAPGWAKQKSIEQRFRSFLDTMSPDQFDAKLKLLASVVDSATADVMDAWRRCGENGLSVQVGLLRWLFDIAIWKRNNGIPVDVWQDFLSKLLVATNGKSRLSNDDTTNLIRMSELCRLRAVCAVVGSGMLTYEPRRRTQRRPVNAIKSFDLSHVDPFSLVGEGPAIMEPASINRARGNRGSVPLA